MTFANLWVLLFLWVIPLLLFFWVICERLRNKAFDRFAAPELHLRLTGPYKKGRKHIKYALLLTAVGLMIISLAGPRWGFYYQDQKGVDMMVLVDVSDSMLANDIAPTRIEQARREIADFLNIIQGDRAGLVAFAGAAFILCPLTLDAGALNLFLDLIEPRLIPVPGTDLGAAIDAGVKSFDFESDTDKVILLVTDGEDHEGGGLAAAKTASQKEVKIFVLGIGTKAGAPIPDLKEDGKSFKKDQFGKTILSKPDIRGLKQIAETTGGMYVQSVLGDSDLDTLYFKGIKARSKDTVLKGEQHKVPKERFALFLIPAILLLMAEALMVERRQIAKISVVLSIFVTMIFLGGIPSRGYCEEDPDMLYRKGYFADAEKIYNQLDMDHPEDMRFRYNRGCALFKNHQYQEAALVFANVLENARDNKMRSKAAYNLGNFFYLMMQFKGAEKMYRKAVIFDPDNEDARYNLELMLWILSQLPSFTEGAPPKGSPQKKDPRDKPSPGQGQQQSERQSQDEQTQDEPEPFDLDDLSGDLKTLSPMTASQEDLQSDDAYETSMDEKKASTFLDNVKEDRRQFVRSRMPNKKRRLAGPFKDW